MEKKLRFYTRKLTSLLRRPDLANISDDEGVEIPHLSLSQNFRPVRLFKRSSRFSLSALSPNKSMGLFAKPELQHLQT